MLAGLRQWHRGIPSLELIQDPGTQTCGQTRTPTSFAMARDNEDDGDDDIVVYYNTRLCYRHGSAKIFSQLFFDHPSNISNIHDISRVYGAHVINEVRMLHFPTSHILHISCSDKWLAMSHVVRTHTRHIITVCMVHRITSTT